MVCVGNAKASKTAAASPEKRFDQAQATARKLVCSFPCSKQKPLGNLVRVVPATSEGNERSAHFTLSPRSCASTCCPRVWRKCLLYKGNVLATVLPRPVRLHEHE